MRGVQADDAAAFGVLCGRMAPRALGLAASICVDRENAPDAVQEGFLSVWRGRAAYEPERGEVHHWILGIVRNRAIDNRRRNGRHTRNRCASDGTPELRAQGDVLADVIAADTARELQLRLGDLPVLQREIITLAFFKQLTHQEIADHLGVPLGTVKSRIRLATARLRLTVGVPHDLPGAAA